MVVGRVGPNDQNLPIAFVVIRLRQRTLGPGFLNLLFKDIVHSRTNSWVILFYQQKVLIFHHVIFVKLGIVFFSLISMTFVIYTGNLPIIARHGGN